MARPLEQGVAATTQDVQALMKVVRRIQGDPTRSEKEKEEMTESLNSVISKLLTPGAGKARSKGKSAA